jgi:hypothetical protein
MKQVQLYNNTDGEWFVELYNASPWLVALDKALSLFTEITGHIFCCHVPEWTYRIKLGKPDIEVYDGHEINFNTLGYRIWEIGQKLSISYGREMSERVMFKIDPKQAYIIDPNDAEALVMMDIDDDLTSSEERE